MVDHVRTVRQLVGDEAEEVAARHLESRGWRVIARGVHVGRSEIDILAVDPGPPASVVVVEVRFRSRRDFGRPEETLDPGKRHRIRRAAFELLAAGATPDGHLIPKLPLRIDLIAIEPAGRGREGAGPTIRHHRAIF